MTKKYYLEIEIRYLIPETDELEEIRFNKFIHSGLFDNEDGCIFYGNNLIRRNRWIEQYPGYENSELDKKLGGPFEYFKLKNGAEIFITVKSLKIFDFNDMELELQKFNISEINEKL